MSSLTRDHIDIPGLLAEVSHPGGGGTALFLGSVRRGPEDGPVEAIEYSAYEEMAEREIQRILSEAGERWPDSRCVLRHRLGTVPAGEVSIAAAAATPHRAEAFEACRYVIEEAKKRLPIWKKELLEDGTSNWRSNAEAKREAWGSPSS